MCIDGGSLEQFTPVEIKNLPSAFLHVEWFSKVYGYIICKPLPATRK